MQPSPQHRDRHSGNRHRGKRGCARALLVAAAAALASCGEAPGPAGQAPAPAEAPAAAASAVARTIVQRTGDADAGRRLFIDKACVLCHSVNGVGGRAAPALDAETELDPVDPLGFAARMWRGAPAMIELQNLQLGYTIWLDADEMMHLAAFAADSGSQKALKPADIPDALRALILDEPYWANENWDLFLRQGQEGFGEPTPTDVAAPDPD